MGYADFIKQMLMPLGVYDLQKGYGCAEISAVGDALDKAEAPLDIMLEELSGENLKKAEALFPIMHFWEREEERRDALKTLAGTNDGSCTKGKLEKQIKACGFDASISETGNKFVVNVNIGNIRGELSDEEISVLREILPCHLQVNFICSGVTWDRIEALYPKWNDFDAAGITISEMMKLA